MNDGFSFSSTRQSAGLDEAFAQIDLSLSPPHGQQRSGSEILPNYGGKSQPEVAARLASESQGFLDGEFATDHFRIYEFKIKRCPRSKPHDWTACPFAHPGEKAKRRDPLKFQYSTRSCPNHKKTGQCPRGQSCPLAHGVFECWLHPSRYRTHMCSDGTDCRRKICFFAHSPEELREPPPEDPELTKKVTMILGDKSYEDDDFALAESLGLGMSPNPQAAPQAVSPLGSTGSPAPGGPPPGAQNMAVQNHLLKQQLQVLQQLLRMQVSGGTGGMPSQPAARLPSGTGSLGVSDITDQIGRLELMQAQKLQEILQMQSQIEQLQGLAASKMLDDGVGGLDPTGAGMAPGPSGSGGLVGLQALNGMQTGQIMSPSASLIGGGPIMVPHQNLATAAQINAAQLALARSGQGGPSGAGYLQHAAAAALYDSHLAAAQAHAQAQQDQAQAAYLSTLMAPGPMGVAGYKGVNGYPPGSRVSNTGPPMGPSDMASYVGIPGGPGGMGMEQGKTSQSRSQGHRSFMADHSSLLGQNSMGQGGHGHGSSAGPGSLVDPNLHPHYPAGSTVPRRPVAIPVLPSMGQQNNNGGLVTVEDMLSQKQQGLL